MADLPSEESPSSPRAGKTLPLGPGKSRRTARLAIIGFILVLVLVGALIAVALVSVRSGSEIGVRKYNFETKQTAKIIGDRTYTVNTINGHIKGPVIHVKKGETLSVNVKNGLTDSGLTIHWHGFHMKGQQIYDGVEGITQCPIAPGESYLYHFVVDEQPGTYWYHSHNKWNPSGQQFIRGPLVVHDIDATINHDQAGLKDSYQMGNEIILFYRDLYPNYLGFDFPLLQSSKVKFSDKSFEGTGTGMFAWASGVLNGDQQHEMKIQNGEYRFRIINGGDNFVYFFSIDKYKLTVVATDGHSVEPFETDVIEVHVGERYDVLVTFNITTPTENIWVRAMTTSKNQDKGILGIIRVRKDKSVAYNDAVPQGKHQKVKMKELDILNCKYFDEPDFKCHPVTDLVPAVLQDSLDFAEEFHTVDFDFFGGLAGWFVSINKNTFTQNLLPQKPSIMASATNELSPHSLVLSLPTNKSVTIVLRNKNFGNHPMHLHGHTFEVLEIATRETATCDNKICPLLDPATAFSKPIEQLMKRPTQGVLKDTVIMPAGGAVALRINTDNPGVWFFHCHAHIHLLEGMGFVINEGNYMFSQTEFPKDYPSCDLSGKLQMPQSVTCDCIEKDTFRAGLQLKCSSPWLCGG